ncbi:hypothetical protein H6G06_18895 [Anabaena sphaerica FACHB-251]|uniref:Calcium-binding protein n=1 Tax=Anabaena sphaerica FACHB-251 TaxID=2692883 RepID=A0A926WJT7_9NOST|nr:calcium-binding protein [Anabaena sphaerica]MBD2295480.1 hypothetical protein [Anabaena sphaerica FACHB-251]
MNVFGTNNNDTLMGGQGADSIYGYGGDDTLYGGVGDDLDGADGNDTFIATEAATIIGGSGINTLISNYSQSNDGVGIHLDANPRGLFMHIDQLGGGRNFLRFGGIDALNVTGTQYNDILDGGMLNATLNGGAGNDALLGQKGVFSGGSGTDTLTANYYTMNVPYGVHLGWNGENTVRRRDNGSIILTHDGIEAFNFTGTDFLDYLSGQNGDDIFYGLGSNDILEGGNGNDILDGGRGNDILDGGNGKDQLFDVSGSDTLKGGAGDDYLYTVADTQGAIKQLYGGQGADTFVVDIKGDINLGFDFDVAKLGNFVNAITLPENNGLDWQRLGIDVAFSALGAGLGAIPVVGSLASFWTSLAQTGVDAYLDQEELEAQINEQLEKANQAVKQYGTQDWGKVFQQGTRDVIYINDFQIGLDNILLPRLPDATHFYQVDLVNGGQGGVFVSVRNSGVIEQFKNVAFIANNYTDVGITDQKFQEIITDLIQGSTIGTFTKTAFIGQNNVSATEIITATFANDNIQANGGNDEVFGYYGDDVIQGGDGNDTIYGGSNRNPSYARYESEYGNDGNDIISGGAGNDVLYGESGNDFLNGDEGNDLLYGGVGNNTLVGGAGDDILVNTNGTVDGGTGTDTLIADYTGKADGNGVHLGWASTNHIYNRVNGQSLVNFSNVENFNITGTQYSDAFEGRSGNDIFNGGAGNDELYGAAGDDILNPGYSLNSTDIVDGGTGNDTLVVDYSAKADGAGIHLGWSNTNNVFNRLNGQLLVNVSNVENFNITGTQYSDAFQGRSGNDIFNGGAGDDYLYGGVGNDTLTGGIGADQFVFNSVSEGIDVIKDFSWQQGDKIQILGSSFGASSTNQFNFNTSTGALSFNGQQFATLENISNAYDFIPSYDIVIV